jgi:Transposase IS116/IS110/IS902 family
MLGDGLRRWPPLQAAHRARRSTLATCLRAPQVRAAAVLAPRLNAIQAAIPLTPDAGLITPHGLLVHALVSPLRATLPAIQDVDHASAPPAQRHPDCPVFHTLPGPGPVVAPRLLVACGEPRAREAAAAARHQCAGMAPVTERRGTKGWGHGRFQGPTVLRHTFVEWAAASIRQACWARVYDQPPRDAGTAPQATVRALACTWLRLLSRCWQDRTPDHESVSLHALTRRGSSLIHNLAKESSTIVKNLHSPPQGMC